MNVYRIFVEKRQEFSVEAANILTDLRTAFQIDGLSRLRILNRYDVEGITEKTFEKAKTTIFSEPQVDMLYSKMDPLEDDEYAFAMEYLPGQFDQRADSCAQCIALLTQTEKPTVRTAKIFILSGKISDQDFKKVKAYLINPVESREASFEIPETLEEKYPNPGKVKILKNFGVLTREQQTEFAKQFGLAMDVDDIAFCQQYFRDEEKREPTMTELRVIDTYWSDHCRHTTFQTELDNVEIIPDYIQKTWKRYRDCRAKLYKKQNKPITLMDIATMGAKKLKADGDLSELDESEEINACSVKIRADIDGKEEDWLLMFKNETHNHPTEIEPFGGAATCLGGAIRDPLSGRSYVYQAMRVTGAADPRVSVDKTLKGKLPQRKITVGAASGYSSYGNQIGLATGQVTELYHSGYAAKRLETGAVVGATPAANVVRERPAPGDIVILLGGRTGRDGMGGATGSSKSHTTSSLSTCGAEVQKGNPPEERKIQRLFRDPEVTHMIKRCNDFGAGGISVAIGELADGLKIDLNAVPRKYAGLDGTELAISESQERMAVVVATKDVERFIEKAQNENVEATAVAEVSSSPRLRMYWEGSCIVNISRKFLDSNGAPKHASARIDDVDISKLYTSVSESDLRQRWKSLLEDLNICSQKGLGDRFDSTIGSATVLLPYGGMNQLTPTQAMAAKLPVLNGETSTCSLMAFGCNPHIADISPYHAGTIAVVESVARIIASGGSLKNTWLSFQEFFEKLRQEPLRWGKPLSALLGALEAQLGLGIAAIGGKDSMSGSFESLDVPSTIISFACGITNAQRVISPEFKTPGDKLVLFKPKYDRNGLPVFSDLRRLCVKIENLISTHKAKAVWALSDGGIAEGISKMAFGNRIGFTSAHGTDSLSWFDQCYGGFLVEAEPKARTGGKMIGNLTSRSLIEINGTALQLTELQNAWERPLEEIFPTKTPQSTTLIKTCSCPTRTEQRASTHGASPRVLIPVFPGTNCEYDSARKFTDAGAICETFIIHNLTATDISESVLAFEKSIHNSQIIMIPGGFSGGDEPDGSGKFITAFFRNPRIKDAVTEFLNNRDGLMLGICNGFQALIKLGLVPFGEIKDMTSVCPTLTFNAIGRHQSTMVRTRVASVKSPWMAYCNTDDVYTIPVSHGEGRFVATPEMLEALEKNGQIATQYVDFTGHPSGDIHFNPNDSVNAIEGIFSPDGHIFGKMAHSERCGKYICKNIDGQKDQPIFRAGVDYFAL